MARIITNYATLDYQNGNERERVTSNVAQTTLQQMLGITKDAYSATYRRADTLTYVVQITSAGESPTSVTVEDNLGTFTENGVSYTPLDYESYLLYVGQTLNPETGGVSVTVEELSGRVRFVFGNLPNPFPGLTLIMQMKVNDFAAVDPQGVGITNTTGLWVSGQEVASDEATVLAEEYADLRILKSMTPDPVNEGGRLTYTFAICNYGTSSPTQVTLRDQFSPAPEIPLTVTVDGVAVDAFDYNRETGLFVLGSEAVEPYALVLPPATFERDPVTGMVTVNASRIIVTVSGIIRL